MDEKDEAELEATRAALEQLQAEGSTLTGDALLSAATERAGYSVDMSPIERCDDCGALYHRHYGGEYVDPNDHEDLKEELGLESMQKLFYMHFCDFQCLQDKARALYSL